MKIGIPKEIKNLEHRVALTTQGVRELVHHGHEVFVEKNAGIHIGLSDENYAAVGAKIKETKQELYQTSELIVKVKEPQLEETNFLSEGQVVFSYLHLAVEPEMTKALLAKKITGIAYETITGDKHPLPLLFAMSEIAGKLSIQAGAFYLEKARGGRGILLGGAVGTEPARVTILGGGTSGTAAAKIALGMGAEVTIFEKSLDRMRELTDLLKGNFKLLFPSEAALEEQVSRTDLLIGGVLLPGGVAPKIVSRKMIASMKPGAVVVDIAIDQGGCIETSRPTTHSAPIYIEEDVIHYCVTNMPAAVPLTSSHALENSIMSYLLKLASGDIAKVLQADKHLLNGLNVYQGNVTNEPVAEGLGHSWVDPSTLL